MAISTYTLLSAVNIVGFRCNAFKQKLDTLLNADVATDNMIECFNSVFREIAKVKGLPYLVKTKIFPIAASYTTNTVTVTNASATVTGSGTTWVSAMVGRSFAVTAASYSAIYEIADRPNATTLTLGTPTTPQLYAEATASGVSYVIAQDKITLPDDFNDLISVVLSSPDARKLEVLSPSRFDFQRNMQRVTPHSTGTPSWCTVYPKSGAAPTDSWQLVLDPMPSLAGSLTLMYRAAPTKFSNLDGGLYLPIGDESIDVVLDGARAKWRETAGVEGGMAEWANWQANVLARFAALDTHQADEMAYIQPATFRGSQPSRI